MEQENMKSAWKALNEKIDANHLATKNALARILESRRKTALQKMVSVNKFSLFLIFLVTGVAVYVFFIAGNPTPLFIVVQLMLILFISAVFNLISFRTLSKMNLSRDVITLYRQISSNKRLTVWVYIIVYLLVFSMAFSFILVYPQVHILKAVFAVTIAVALVSDFFIYRWWSGQIRTLIDTSRELKELSEWEK